MSELELKQRIEHSLARFAGGTLLENGIGLLNTLGYQSERQVLLTPNTFEGLVDVHPPFAKVNQEKASVADWLSVDILFQLTGDDIRKTAQAHFVFEDIRRVDDQIVESFLFLAIRLKQKDYPRSKLAGLTREINKCSAMPVIILIQHGDALTLAIIHRRLNKKNENVDVLEKVTLIKDIRIQHPHRAHIEILADFHLEKLHADFRVNNFVQLANAWERRLGTYALTERFYRDIANWYFATLQDPRLVYPRSVKTEEQRSMFLIRLLTRLIFCWFLQEKGLIQPEVFSYQKASELLKDVELQSGTYYRGILQNLFFATLNEVQNDRKFRSKNPNPSGRDGNRGVSQFYRYEALFHKPQDLVAFFKDIPFLNGGLFECLDTVYRKEENQPNIRFDDFSEEKGNTLYIPNDIFFGKEHIVDLSKVYDDSRKRREKARGLIDLLDSYKFTIEENTPLEEEIALDPELLGKVFENLLASYNEDTRTTARKSTGSFYTPREIVDYMVDETLLVYLREQVPDTHEEDLRTLLRMTSDETDLAFTSIQKEALISAIDNVRVLDPACGSGAFPMGILQRLVVLLARLDPNNAHWKQQQLEKAERDLRRATHMEDENIRKVALAEATARVKDIQHSFDTRYHELDFARKLYLIENCIYGVDIQPIAVQIAKLRFFITLVVDQKTDPNEPNQGVRPLPNLETKLVAANSLLPLAQSKQLAFSDYTVEHMREELCQVRHEYFRARTPARKAECRLKDAELRQQIALELQNAGWPPAAATKLATWDPYNPNLAADFLEPKWMFGGQTRSTRPASGTLRGGFGFVNESAGQMELLQPNQETENDWLFDIVLGNPPYVRQEQLKDLKPLLKPLYECYTGTADLYVYFYERGIKLLRPGGAFAFITSNKWMRSAYGEGLRSWLSKNTTIHQLIDFGDESIFTALAYPCIVILTKNNLSTKNKELNNDVAVLNWQSDWDSTHFTEVFNQQAFNLPQKELNSNSWQIAGQVERRLLEKLELSGTSLGKYANNRIYRGITTGANEAFIIDEITKTRLINEHSSAKELIKPLLRGKDVKRWGPNFAGMHLCFVGWSTPIEQYPSIFHHLSQFESTLKARPEVRDGRFPWYSMSRYASEYWQEFEKRKIITPTITNKANFAFDENGYYGNDKTNFLVPTDTYLTLAVLNSPIIWWLATRRFASRMGGFYEFKPMYLSQLPMPSYKSYQLTEIERIVTYILALSQSGPNDQVHLSAFENLLNGLVYALFFPIELEKANLPIFELVIQSKLPDLSNIPKNEHIAIHQNLHEILFLSDHPVRSALFSLRGLDFVRIIEEESNTNLEASLNEDPED